MRVGQGEILTRLNREIESPDLHDYEFQVFSQCGDDGIIQRLVDVIEIRNKTFIEFGVEDFHESNCRFLMVKDNWSGFVIDGSTANINRLRASHFFWKFDLQSAAAFVTRENVDPMLRDSGFDEDLGILSIDVDGNDYHLLAAVESFQPRILILEFNAVFGSERKITVPYRPDFNRTDAHHSNLFWGASLGALDDLAQDRGYSLVGTNSAGNNAFFVRNDVMDERIPALSVDDAYSPSKFRESRDHDGSMDFLRGEAREQAIRGMTVLNVETGELEPF
jgi:hypothetical protein